MIYSSSASPVAKFVLAPVDIEPIEATALLDGPRTTRNLILTDGRHDHRIGYLGLGKEYECRVLSTSHSGMALRRTEFKAFVISVAKILHGRKNSESTSPLSKPPKDCFEVLVEGGNAFYVHSPELRGLSGKVLNGKISRRQIEKPDGTSQLAPILLVQLPGLPLQFLNLELEESHRTSYEGFTTSFDDYGSSVIVKRVLSKPRLDSERVGIDGCNFGDDEYRFPSSYCNSDDDVYFVLRIVLKRLLPDEFDLEPYTAFECEEFLFNIGTNH